MIVNRSPAVRAGCGCELCGRVVRPRVRATAATTRTTTARLEYLPDSPLHQDALRAVQSGRTVFGPEGLALEQELQARHGAGYHPAIDAITAAYHAWLRGVRIDP